MIVGGGYGYGRALGAQGYGFAYGVAEVEHHGGGYTHHHRRKSYKQLKKEYYVLPYTLLDEERDEVSDVLEELKAKLQDSLERVKNSVGLTSIIAMLQEQIAYQKLKLEAIEYVEQRKKAIILNHKREQDIAFIAFMLDED